jgi:hypothetical protein
MINSDAEGNINQTKLAARNLTEKYQTRRVKYIPIMLQFLEAIFSRKRYLAPSSYPIFS